MVVKVGGGAEVLTDASSSASDEDVQSVIAEESRLPTVSSANDLR